MTSPCCGQHKEVKLGPAEIEYEADAGLLFTLLPDKQMTTNIGTPFAGSYFYYSGSGNDLDNNMTAADHPAGAGPISLSFQGTLADRDVLGLRLRRGFHRRRRDVQLDSDLGLGLRQRERSELRQRHHGNLWVAEGL